MQREAKRGRSGPDPVGPAIRRNIAALRERRAREMELATTEEKIADAVTAFTGSLRFVYLHVAIYGAWIIVNLVPGWPHFDPTFVILAMVASVEAIFLSTFVLISQNRAAAAADKRSDLDLQVNLLTEHELTRLARMVAAIADHLDVDVADPEAIDEVTRDLAPEAVLEEIEKPERPG